MDFNTGRGSGRPPNNGSGGPSGPMFGGEGPRNGPSDGPGGGTGTEFSLSDPVGSFIRTTVNVLIHPTDFFRGIRRQGDFVSPAVYATTCTVIAAVVSGLVGLALRALFSSISAYEGAVANGVLGFVTDVILTPFATIVVLFVLSGIYHLLVVLLARPAHSGFEATYRVMCYVSAIALIGWIPVVNLIVSIYGLYIAYFGIREVHSTTNQRAAAVVALPALTFILLIILATGTAILLRVV